MKVELCRTFTFSAAHALPRVADGHPCRVTHGHNFTVEVALRGEVDPATGFLMDYGDLKRVAQPVIDRLDHGVLNEIPGLENATSENLARWIWDQLHTELPDLHHITVRETAASSCTYWGEA